eukprot:Filipodium_phascolosomae@DN2739_c0_g1_i3.p1
MSKHDEYSILQIHGHSPSATTLRLCEYRGALILKESQLLRQADSAPRRNKPEAPARQNDGPVLYKLNSMLSKTDESGTTGTNRGALIGIANGLDKRKLDNNLGGAL